MNVSTTNVTLILSTGFKNGTNGRISDNRKFHGAREKELPASFLSRLWIWIHIQGISILQYNESVQTLHLDCRLLYNIRHEN